MGNASGKLADAFHLLRLQELLLCFLARSDLHHQFLCTFLDSLFKRLCQIRKRYAFRSQFAKKTFPLQLRCFACCDIGRNANKLIYFADCVPERAGAHINPVHRAVRPDIPMLDHIVVAGS